MKMRVGEMPPCRIHAAKGHWMHWLMGRVGRVRQVGQKLANNGILSKALGMTGKFTSALQLSLLLHSSSLKQISDNFVPRVAGVPPVPHHLSRR